MMTDEEEQSKRKISFGFNIFALFCVGPEFIQVAIPEIFYNWNVRLSKFHQHF